MSQQINLYEARLRPRRELATGRNLGVAALVVLLAVAGVATWAGVAASQKTEAAASLQKQAAEQQEQLVTLTKAVAERRVAPALAAELEKYRAALATRAEAVEQLESGRQGSAVGFSEVFSGFARQATPNLWLTGFAVTRGGEDIEIRGRALDAAVLPAYVQRLGSEPAFRGRRFAGLEMLDREQKDEAAEQPAKAGTATTATQPAARLPRFVEFVLRSEHVSVKNGLGAESGAPGGGGGR